MRKDTIQYIRSCEVRNKANVLRPKHSQPLGQLDPPAYEMGDRIHIDLLDMPRSNMGHVAICNLVDPATGFIFTNPVLDKTSTGVAQTPLEKFIPYFGCPKVLVTDKGKENENSEIALLCSKFNIKHITSSTYHPQSNGLVERRQQMILNFLRKSTVSADFQGNWPNLLSSILSQTRGFSPFLLTFFRSPNFPFNNLIWNRHLHQNSCVSDKINNAKTVLQQACDNYNLAFKERKNPHDPLAEPVQEGSIVYVCHSQRGLHIKLTTPFKGPYTCILMLHNNNVAGGKIIHTHVKNCKIVPLRPEHLVLNPLLTQKDLPNKSANDFRYSHRIV